MNILEAICSGHRFRRTSWLSSNWLRVDGDKCLGPNEYGVVLTLPDITANDWVTEESHVEITTSRFWAAAEQSFASALTKEAALLPTADVKSCLNTLAEKLGLEKKL